MSFSVIIPTYNRYAKLVNAIRSVYNQSFDKEMYEIIIVDNASTDETKNAVQEIKECYGKLIRYVYEPKPGLHWARHAGAKEAIGRVLAYTDDDAEVTFNWLESLAVAYEDPEVGAAGGPIRVKWSNEPPKWAPPLGTFGHLDLGNKYKELSWPEAIYGGNFSIRRSILFKLGGFFPDTSVEDKLVGDGEIGLCRKLYGAGWKVVFVPNALVYHVQDGKNINLKVMKHRFEQQGRSWAYTDYRSQHHNIKKFMHITLNSLLIACKFRIGSVLYFKAKSQDYYRCRVYSAAYSAKVFYSIKILVSKKFREIVMREDWING